MTVPILMTLGSVADPTVMPMAQLDAAGVDQSFGETLGIALGSVPMPALRPAEPALLPIELVLDGEWRQEGASSLEDGGPGPDGQPHYSAPGAIAPARMEADRPAVTSLVGQLPPRDLEMPDAEAADGPRPDDARGTRLLPSRSNVRPAIERLPDTDAPWPPTPGQFRIAPLDVEADEREVGRGNSPLPNRDVSTVVATPGPQKPAAVDGEIVPLGKSLDDWLRRFGRGQTAQPTENKSKTAERPSAWKGRGGAPEPVRPATVPTSAGIAPTELSPDAVADGIAPAAPDVDLPPNIGAHAARSSIARLPADWTQSEPADQADRADRADEEAAPRWASPSQGATAVWTGRIPAEDVAPGRRPESPRPPPEVRADFGSVVDRQLGVQPKAGHEPTPRPKLQPAPDRVIGARPNDGAGPTGLPNARELLPAFRPELFLAFRAEEGLDPEALLARRVRPPDLVEIGGFAFPAEIAGPEATPISGGALRAEAVDRSPREAIRVPTLGTPPAISPEPSLSGGPFHSSEQREPPGRDQPEREWGGDSSPRREGERAPAGPLPIGAGGAAAFEVDVLPVAGVRAPAAAQVVDRIARRVDHLLLDLSDEQGDVGRLRVSVSGQSVRATILSGDPALADRLNGEIRQLRMSLTERGFADPTITVVNTKTEPDSWRTPGREPALGAPILESKATVREPGSGDRRDSTRDQPAQRHSDERPPRRSRDHRQENQGGQP